VRLGLILMKLGTSDVTARDYRATTEPILNICINYAN